MCPYCKAEIESTDNFCRMCAADLRPFQTRCENCGTGFNNWMFGSDYKMNNCPMCASTSLTPPAQALP